MDQESNYEDMSREIQRIDSEKGFEMKLLKSNIRDQLEELAPLPELIELSEKRLNDAISAKFAIESSLQMKVQELKVLKNEVNGSDAYNHNFISIIIAFKRANLNFITQFIDC